MDGRRADRYGVGLPVEPPVADGSRWLERTWGSIRRRGRDHSRGSHPWSEVPEEPTVQGELPLGPEFLGALSGELKVNPSGGATYTVPITVPPGTAGMAPKLSLVYDSQRGNAIAGHGWELTGLSTIHRCPKNRVQDGRAKPVLNSYIDEFNHQGAKRTGSASTASACSSA